MNVLAVAIADSMGFILLIALLVSSRVRRAKRDLELKIFTYITILTMVSCVVDFFSFYSDGKPGKLWHFINVFANTFCFMSNPVFISCWCLYEDIKLYNSKARVKRIYTKAFIPAVIMVIVAFLNIFFPIIFYIDEANVYHRLNANYAFYVVDLGYLVMSIVILICYEKRYGKAKFFPLYLMMGPIVLGTGIQAMFYGVSLIWVSLAIGLTAIYMSLQNEFSYLDTLTGLYNRAYLDYQMDNFLKDKNAVIGAIMIDVDYFKSINDTLGHSAGDEALVDVARVIILSKPDKAIATRFAGDEFIVLVNNTSHYEMQNIIRNIREELKIFNENEGRHYKLSLSLGYAIYDVAKDDRDGFFRRMDDNMYEEKKLKHG